MDVLSKLIQIIKNNFKFVLFGFAINGMSQYIQIDSQSYSPQQLIENILMNNACIDNIVVTNVVGGDFSGTDQSFGYFNASGTTFPIQSGIVLGTGRLQNTIGPNDNLSDDDAPNWGGDTDLEMALNESNTTNATSIEFDFSTVASQISFRYIFASEEFQEFDPNTCQYSDLFGFLIRPVGQTTYTNIALIPGTTTPVKVTTVHPYIDMNCAEINEAYFGQYNWADSPINFNGETKVLTATSPVVPNQMYHVKLVIADEQNYRYDSAVFLEAGSFVPTTEFGPDLTKENKTALCQNDNYLLDATQIGATSFAWYKNGVLLPTETNSTLVVNSEGKYNVEVNLNGGCISYGDLIIEYSSKPVVVDATLTECDFNQDGITQYNLFNIEQFVILGNSDLYIYNFYENNNDAILNQNSINNADIYQNTTTGQKVYARVQSYTSNCFEVAEVTLDISTIVLNINAQFECDQDEVDGFTLFDLNSITTSFRTLIPTDAIIDYYLTENDAFNELNKLSNPFQNTVIDSQQIFVKVISNNQCYALETVELNVLQTPILSADNVDYYCTDNYPQTKRIESGLLNEIPSDFTFKWLLNGVTTGVLTDYINIDKIGLYEIIVTSSSTGCSNTRTITVNESNKAIIENITINQGTYNNTVLVNVSGVGDYEFSLDGFNYSINPEFKDILPGFYTIYVRDKKGCEITTQLISVLGFPKYFTPNNDGQNDTWQVFGVNDQFQQGITILIFDRYGKLVAKRNNFNNGWDGMYNGIALQSTDYWYTVILADGIEYNGHFALIR